MADARLMRLEVDTATAAGSPQSRIMALSVVGIAGAGGSPEARIMGLSVETAGTTGTGPQAMITALAVVQGRMSFWIWNESEQQWKQTVLYMWRDSDDTWVPI